jgi:hypothetical protein
VASAERRLEGGSAMSALEELAGLEGLVAERGESWLALEGFG